MQAHTGANLPAQDYAMGSKPPNLAAPAGVFRTTLELLHAILLRHDGMGRRAHASIRGPDGRNMDAPNRT